jgi:hypothetical protein
MSAAACFGCDEATGARRELVAVEDDDETAGPAASATDAVAMDNRDRTRSKGYVEPAKNDEAVSYHVREHPRRSTVNDVQTEVMPAKAPLASRLGVSSSFDP